MGDAQPRLLHDYVMPLMDSRRWKDFEARADDIYVCTSYKAGTTWTQMICALLIFQTPKLPGRLAELSPWIDVLTAKIEDILATYEAQTHRRFIKTHTPLDGLPWYEKGTYLYCGRDPRDVFLSMVNHIQNMDPDTLARILTEQGLPAPPPMDASGDPNAIFRMWLTTGSVPWEKDGFPFWSHLNHARTFWEYRHLPNIHLLHFSDLQADLEGHMRGLSETLGLPVPEERWPELVEAATFDSMKSRAAELAPEAKDFWKNSDAFFHKGSSGQWQGVLDEESLALYEKVKAERLSPELGAWLEQGTLAWGDPKDVPA